MRRAVIFPLLALVLLAGGLVPAQAADDNPPALENARLVHEVASGKRTIANAAWWGFDPDDATECLQRAIRSGAKRVIVPFTSRDWVVQPIQLASNQEIVFEPGVVVAAKKGAFKGPNDSLFSASLRENITLIGYGATLRMRKHDYVGPDYAKAEWRMALAFRSCTGIQVLGLTLEASGGDGIYLGRSSADRVSCRNVVIRDVVCDNHYRQGISVISAENLLIENCRLTNTAGTPPAAGIDFEPNSAIERLANCILRRCVIANNAGPGILMYLHHLSDAAQSAPVGILVENCLIQGSQAHGIGISMVHDGGPKGLIEFRNCVVRDTRREGARITNKSSKSIRVRFAHCKWLNTGQPGRHASVGIVACEDEGKAVPRFPGGIEFVNCHVYQQRVHGSGRNLPAVLAYGNNVGRHGLHDIRGNVVVMGLPADAKLMDLGPKLSGVTLRATAHRK